MEDVETKIKSVFYIHLIIYIYIKSEGRKIHELSVMLDSQIREKKTAYNKVQIDVIVTNISLKLKD